ncbi:Fatty acid desaturase, partial [Crocosphaera watsonii WH 0003]
MQSAQTLPRVPREYLKPPGGLNPNVVMFFTALSLIGCSISGYWLWQWPDWICFFCSVLALHMSGTVIHDASHNSAHSNRIINAILG